MKQPPRLTWAVIMRVTPVSRWCGYGPATHRQALEFRKRTIGAGIEREVVQLIPMPSELAHTDHPLRHYDRTCPACNAASHADQKEQS